MDESVIVAHMEIAKRIGLKYAKAHGRFADEAVAEAYFWLVHFFKVDYILWEKSVRPEWTLGVYIKRALMKYFDRLCRRNAQPLNCDRYNRGEYSEDEDIDIKEQIIVRNTDEEMIEFLSGLTNDETAWKIFALLREGNLNLFTLDMVDPSFRKVLKKLRLQVSARVHRIKHLQSIGLTTSREVWPDAGNEALELLGVQALRE